MQTIDKLIPHVKCKAKTRTGVRCGNRPIKSKDVCRMHGGKTPIKHGLYSKYAQGKLADHIEELINNPKLTRLEEVIATQAALLRSHLEQVEEKPETRGNVLEVSKALVTSIEKWHKITYGEKQVIRVESVKGVADEIVDVITQYVPDKKKHPMILKQIENRIMRVSDGSSPVH